MKTERLPNNWWKEKLIEAFNYFWWKAKVYQLQDYIYKTYENNLIKYNKNKNKSIYWQLQFYSSQCPNFKGKEDLFYRGKNKNWKIINWIWYLKKDYQRELKKTIFQAPDSEINEIIKRKNTTINRIIRDTKIVKELKELYQNKCQICWNTIKIKDNLYYSEWHHIKPLWKDYNWPDIKENIIILCPNHHAEFDYWVIAISIDWKKVISKNEDLKDLQILKHKINKEFLEYHLENIYKK